MTFDLNKMTDEDVSRFALETVESSFDPWVLETFKKLGKTEKKVVEDIVISTAIVHQLGVDRALQLLERDVVAMFLSIPSEYGPKALVEEVIKRVYDGQDRYGLLGESRDDKGRNFRKERFEEVADAIVYDHIDRYFLFTAGRELMVQLEEVFGAHDR